MRGTACTMRRVRAVLAMLQSRDTVGGSDPCKIRAVIAPVVQNVATATMELVYFPPIRSSG